MTFDTKSSPWGKNCHVHVNFGRSGNAPNGQTRDKGPGFLLHSSVPLVIAESRPKAEQAASAVFVQL
jgi:hypothetical protein